MNDIVPQKRCNKCHEEKPATKEHFHANKGKRGGFNGICRDCRTSHTLEELTLRDSIPEGYRRCGKCKEIKLATPEFFHRNKGNMLGLAHRCRVCNDVNPPRERHPVVPQGYKWCHLCKKAFPSTLDFFYKCTTVRDGLKPGCKICHKRYYPSGPEQLEKRSEYNQKYGKEHKELIYEGKKRRYNKDIARARDIHRALYARRHNVPGSYTEQDVQDQIKRQRNKCYYCHNQIKKGKNAYHVDHIVPITRDGSSNDPYNLVIACPTCNCKKGNKLLHEWPEGGRLL